MNRRTFFKGWAAAIAAVLIGGRESPAVTEVIKLPKRAKTALELFRPTESQEQALRAIASGATEVLGIGCNRSGKGVLGAIYVTALATGQPITMRDGSKLYLSAGQSKKPARIVVVGRDWHHMLHVDRHLFEPGLFQVTDETTGEQVPAPPLISLGELASVVWESKKDGILTTCVLSKTGVTIEFVSSCSSRPQGDIDAVWIDEQLEDDIWYPELMSQLVNHRGTMLWTLFPCPDNAKQLQLLEKRGHCNGKHAVCVILRSPWHEERRKLFIEQWKKEAKREIGK